jgi:heat shock protein HslJ
MRTSLVAAASVFLVGTALLPRSGAEAGARRTSTLNGTAWILAELPGHSLLADRPVTLRLEKSRLHGTDGCNRYSAPYNADSDGFHLAAPVVSTKMACSGQVMEQAEAFLSALTNARGARVSGTRLVLVDADGKTLATLGAQSQDLVGTAWRVAAYNNGREAVMSVLPDIKVTLEFSGPDELRGFAGCNDFTAKYSVSQGMLTLSDSTATRKTCSDREDLMKQESLFLKALAMATLVRVDGDRLELRRRDGALAISATRSVPETDFSVVLLTGEMTYMADAARFTDCATGSNYPVAMEGDFASLERAYTAAVKEAGAPMSVTFEGAIADRPKMEGAGTEPTVVVSRFIRLQPDKRCKK